MCSRIQRLGHSQGLEAAQVPGPSPAPMPPPPVKKAGPAKGGSVQDSDSTAVEVKPEDSRKTRCIARAAPVLQGR